MSEATAHVSVVVNASTTEVWNALTDPEAIREYFMGATVTTDWQVASTITFAGEWNGRAYEDKGEILDAEPEKHLRYSHWSPLGGTEDVPDNYHVVDITLSDAEGGTKVTLTQSNLTGGISEADRTSREDYERNWTATLEGLKKTVES